MRAVAGQITRTLQFVERSAKVEREGKATRVVDTRAVRDGTRYGRSCARTGKASRTLVSCADGFHRRHALFPWTMRLGRAQVDLRPTWGNRRDVRLPSEAETKHLLPARGKVRAREGLELTLDFEYAGLDFVGMLSEVSARRMRDKPGRLDVARLCQGAAEAVVDCRSTHSLSAAWRGGR